MLPDHLLHGHLGDAGQELRLHARGRVDGAPYMGHQLHWEQAIDGDQGQLGLGVNPLENTSEDIQSAWKTQRSFPKDKDRLNVVK